MFGRPDAVWTTLDLSDGHWICGETTAMEMKLRNWRRALIQAFRYRAFANCAFVVLDAANARPALQNIDLFRRSSVGLITVDVAGDVEIHYAPDPSPPVCSRMTSKLLDAVIAHIDAM